MKNPKGHWNAHTFDEGSATESLGHVLTHDLVLFSP